MHVYAAVEIPITFEINEAFRDHLPAFPEITGIVSR